MTPQSPPPAALLSLQARRHPDREVRALFEQCSRVMVKLTTLPQPVIARVHGMATAAGCQLVAACDLAICSDDSRFATSGVNGDRPVTLTSSAMPP